MVAPTITPTSAHPEAGGREGYDRQKEELPSYCVTSYLGLWLSLEGEGGHLIAYLRASPPMPLRLRPLTASCRRREDEGLKEGGTA